MTPVKKIVIEELLTANFNAGRISVIRGRGTGHRWVTIKSEVPIPTLIKVRITKRFEDQQLIGHYSDDYGNNDYPTVHWSSLNGSF